MNRRDLMLAMLATAAPLPACATGSASRPHHSVATSVSDILDEAMQKERIPGLSVCATLGDQIAISETRGRASIIFDVPVNQSTLFHIGSVSKHVTAIAILRLSDQGLLSLDAPLSQFLPDISPDWGTRSLRHILSHVSGLPDYFNGFGFTAFDRPVTRDTMFELTRNVPPIAPAGEAFFYSNAGYTLAGYVIEVVTGEAYSDHIAALFREFGLPHARADDGQAVILNRADGYRWDKDQFVRSVQMASTTSAVAAGGLLMSAEDVPAWEAALDSNALLSAASRALLFDSWIYPSGRSSGYAMGWLTDTLDGKTPYYHHTGFVPDYTTVHIRQPDTGLALMMMSTGNGGILDLGLRVAEAICPGTTPWSLSEIADEAPEWTEAVSDILLRATPVDPKYLAAELSVLPAFVQEYVVPKLSESQRAGLKSLRLVQDTRQGNDRLRRYRITTRDQVFHMIATHDGQGKIGFLRRA